MSDLGNKQIMAENIQYFMDLYGLSRKEICDVLGFKYTTLTDWVTAQKYPRIDKIEMLANFFGISKSDLVEKRKPANKDDDELIKKLLSLKVEDIQKVSDYIDLLLIKDQREKNEKNL